METNLISEIQIVPIKPVNGLVAFASFILDNKFYLGSIGIMTRPFGGYRLIYPSKKVGIKNINIYYPINKEMARQIEAEVINHLEDVMNNQNDRHNSFNT
jgi:stage V sporulation protein G